MGATSHAAGGLARGLAGPARVTAFGASVAARLRRSITGLVIVMSHAGSASPLVVPITFVAP